MFSSIGDQFLQKVYDIAEIKLVQITSAIPLTSEQEENIIANLKARTGAKEIKLVSSIDKSILGGLKAQIGSNVIDGSLKSQLIKLATDLETKLF
jgi:F-type H+-transporting ATPase subunit delta